MKHVAAYLLLVLGGNASPDAEAIHKLLASVGIEADKEKSQKLISELKGKKIEDVIAEGSKKLVSLPVGNAAPAAAVSSNAAAKDDKKEEKKEDKKKKEEPKEEEDEDMGFGLFD